MSNPNTSVIILEDDLEQNLLEGSSSSSDSSESTFDSCYHYGVLAAAIILVVCGSASEGAQAMYAECTTFDYNNFIAELSTHNNAPESLFLGLIIIGALATAIQSACLESSYTFEFLKDPRSLISTSAQTYFQLTLLQKSALAATILLGASARGIISIMGYYAINSDLSAIAKASIYASSFIDVILTMGTDGTYLKNNYLWLRSDKNNSASVQDLAVLFDETHGESNPILKNQKSQVAFYSALFLGTLAILGEVGLAALALEQFVSYDTETNLYKKYTELVMGILSLIGFFLLLTTSDTLTFAKKMAIYCEPALSTPTATPTTQPCCTNITTGMASFISIAGASVRAIGTYGGTLHLAELMGFDKTSVEVISIGAVFGTIRAAQCLSLEGMATIQASSAWCTWFKTPELSEYHAITADNKSSEVIVHAQNPLRQRHMSII